MICSKKRETQDSQPIISRAHSPEGFFFFFLPQINIEFVRLTSFLFASQDGLALLSSLSSPAPLEVLRTGSASRLHVPLEHRSV